MAVRRSPSGASVVALLLLAGCGVVYRSVPEQAPRPVAAASTPIARAIAYLANTQVTEAQEAACPRDWAGNWPQYIHGPSMLPLYRIRDVNPFLATFAHHALALVDADSAQALGLDAVDVERARIMRLRAVGLR